ncbi:hypothetical protein GCM10018980_19590 [Streptomyces capoamus]|uniref:Uncharacterized protein n=1 Tax=Streptomyces capoamus TaxID=68183 RepID=A0A919C2G3_9ACTN|nr:hypothetical protein GCM10010501_33180 [Streptomyces libani subsp. rufus]GHG43027.1 hypothetical protein GCM10018980_19590 [Streptomyces capoamus]
MLGTGRFEQAAPGRHGRPPAQQGTTFSLRHSSPDAMLNATVKGKCQTFRAYRATAAYGFRIVLGRPFDEQFIRGAAAACRVGAPFVIRDHPMPSSSPECAAIFART